MQANQPGAFRGMSLTFVVVLLAVLGITISSLLLSLSQGTQRRLWEDQQFHALADLEPKGETSKTEEPKTLTERRQSIQKELENMQKTQDSLMSVFLLGSGAIVGLLTGKLIS
jgi:hypothetical protein